MDNLFLWTCFGFMWLMIFGVILYYIGLVDRKYIRHTMILGMITILSAALCWLLIGYSLSFFGDIQHSVLFFPFMPDEIVSLVVQLLFCLYAVVMLIGSILERGNWRYLVFFVPLWILLIYAPVCYALWGNQNWLSEMGVLDYSGGLVVHATAGIGSLVLAKTLPVRAKKATISGTQETLAFVGMVSITLGWFGFNMALSGEMGEAAIQIWLNTLVSVIAGGFSWFATQWMLTQKTDPYDLMNGMIVGLVASTCSVGYVGARTSLLIALLTSVACPIVIQLIHRYLPSIDDAGDSFGMNGIGGMIGSILTGILAENAHLLSQLIGTVVVCLWSFVLSIAIHYLLRKIIDDVDRQIVS